MRHTLMNLVNTILFEKYVDPWLKVSIYGFILNPCIYISLYPWFVVFVNAYHFLFGICLVSWPFPSSLHYFPQLSSLRWYKWPCPTPCLVTASYENLLHGRRYYTEYTPERKRKVRAFGFCTAQLVDIKSGWALGRSISIFKSCIFTRHCYNSCFINILWK